MNQMMCAVVAAAGLTASTFVMAAALNDQDVKAAQDQEEKAADVMTGDPYPLGVCPISGGELGSMGDPVVKVYEGREVRFCCGGCVKPFEKDLTASFAKLDEQIIESQLPYYPMTTCVVMGDPLVEDGEDIAINQVVNNRLVRVCCKMCKRKLAKEPAEFLKALDAAVIEAQRENYPMDTCVVAGGELGSMGEPAEIVVGNRLVRFCCGGCTGSFKKDPAKYLATIDAAWEAQVKAGGAGPTGASE